MVITWILIVILALLIGFLAFWRLYFLRNPERVISEGRLLLSPADGKVIAVMPFGPSGRKIKVYKGAHGAFGKIYTYTKDVAPRGHIVSIFMSPMDVHYNRAPLAGKVISQKHTPGRFHNAGDFFRSFLENEKNEVVFQSGKLKVKVIQVAGFLARRIVSYVKIGDIVSAGQRYGLINLGSQATLIIPSSVKLSVKKGDRVEAGSSVLGRLP